MVKIFPFHCRTDTFMQLLQTYASLQGTGKVTKILLLHSFPILLFVFALALFGEMIGIQQTNWVRSTGSLCAYKYEARVINF